MHRGLVGEGRGEDQAQPDQGGRVPLLQPVPPYPGTDPLELHRHALEIIARRSHPLPPFAALAAVSLVSRVQRGTATRHTTYPVPPHPPTHEAANTPSTARGGRP